MSTNRTEDTWAAGTQVERLVNEFLKGLGFVIVPTALIERGGAPLLEGHLQNYILPDTLAAKDGQARWVETKYKTRCSPNQIRRREEHGVEAHQWEAYLEVVKKTGLPGSLCIVERERRLILLGAFTEIARSAARVDYGRTLEVYGDAMYYFDCRAFDWFKLGEDGIAALPPYVPPKTVRLWENRPPAVARQGPLL